MTSTKNVHLLISSVTITVVALAYGLLPNNILPKFFDFTIDSVDLKQVFRATMGLYLGMVVVWMTGIVNPKHWRTATLANVLFMLGLALGRIIGLVVDGIPSFPFLAGTVLELALGIWGLINLYQYRVVSDTA